jgi:prepilin-type N-terminal cleavage/methylation domain-containing protein
MIRILPQKKSLAFTLIEMMVAVAVMGILTAVGVVSYRQFNEKQKVVVAGKEVIALLRDSQKKAKSGDRPVECDSPYRVLDGYKMIVYVSTSQVDIVAMCRGLDVVTNTVLLTNDTVFSAGGEYIFNVLSGGVEGAGVISVTHQVLPIAYEVEITESGAINDLGIVE